MRGYKVEVMNFTYGVRVLDLQYTNYAELFRLHH